MRGVIEGMTPTGTRRWLVLSRLGVEEAVPVQVIAESEGVHRGCNPVVPLLLFSSWIRTQEPLVE